MPQIHRLAALLLVCGRLGATGPDRVLPIDVPAVTNADIRAVQDRTYRVLELQAHHLLADVKPWSADPSMKLLTGSASDEHRIRPNTGALEGFCFLHRFGPYDEALTGCSRPDLLQGTILPMTRYLVATHRTGTRPTGDGKPWGHAWQSAHWAQMLGRGAWWVWSDLPPDLRTGVRRVMADEADRIAASTPPHQLHDDTKAEENAWNSQILSVAVLLMPDDARRAEWERQFQRWAMSSFLREADKTSDAIVDGRRVREQFTGANIFDDFTLENHGFIHPDYMATYTLSLGCAADFALTGRKPPEALLHNVDGLYENIKWMLLPDSGSVYPNGQDWELFRMPDGYAKHLLVGGFGRDPESWPLAVANLGIIERMQARHTTGAIFGPDEFFFPSKQTDLLSALSRAWLTLAVAPPPPGAAKARIGTRRLDQARLILNRTTNAIHTLSWGPQIMAQCVPLRMDRIVSPETDSAIGRIRFAGQGKPAPVRVRDIKVDDAADRFHAELLVEHGTRQIEARWTFESRPDGTWTMSEKLTALADVATEDVATGLIGILNNQTWINERGARTVSFDGKATTVTALSGQQLVGESVREISIDGILHIRAAGPLQARYAAAKAPIRGRATDRLHLNVLPGARAWKAGEVLSEFSATMEVQGR